MPHPPQVVLSESVSTHWRSHGVSPVKHVSVQPPPEHTCVALHTTPQSPQLSGSVLVGMQAPLQ
jgi:hypothetical protein